MAKEPNTATKPKTDTPQGNGAAPAPDESQFPSSIVRVLQGVTIEAAPRFRPGHKLTYAEALFASTALVAAARSAFEDAARNMLDPDRVDDEGKKIGAATKEQVQAAWANYYNEYEWSARGDSTPLDPVEAEMRKIARSEIQTALKAAGKKIDGKDKWDFAIGSQIKKHEGRLRKQAEANIKAATANVSEDFLAEIGAAPVAG